MDENKMTNDDKGAVASLKATWKEMPSALQRLVLSRLGTMLLTVLLTIAAIAIMKDRIYAVGFLLALLSAYLAFDILWKFAGGKIYVAKVVVCKANRITLNKHMRITLRDASVTDITSQEFETYQYVIVPSKHDCNSITAGTVMNIYFTEDAPNTILTYTLLGEI